MTTPISKRAITPPIGLSYKQTLQDMFVALNELSGTVGDRPQRAVRVCELLDAGILSFNVDGALVAGGPGQGVYVKRAGDIMTGPLVVPYSLKVISPGTAPADSTVEIGSPSANPGIVGVHAGTKRRDIQFRASDIMIGASSNSGGVTKFWTLNEDATWGRSSAAVGTDRAFMSVTNTDTGTASALSLLLTLGTGAAMSLSGFAPSYTAAPAFTGKIALENADSGVAMSALSASGTHTWYTGVGRILRMTLTNAGALNLVGGGYQFAGLQVLGARNTGWGAQTGTATKTAYATWTHVAVSNPPTQAEVNAISTALQAADRRLKALTDALITHGTIGT